MTLRYLKDKGKIGIPLEIWLERWKDQYDDLPTVEHVKSKYPKVPLEKILLYLSKLQLGKPLRSLD